MVEQALDGVSVIMCLKLKIKKIKLKCLKTENSKSGPSMTANGSLDPIIKKS
jgi:hypothetical protein